MRIGYGYDVHRLEEGRPLIIGGVTIPYKRGLLGHSDADVLLHAITDAILGACAMGDIGQHFSDNDVKYKDADSRVLLRNVMGQIREKGYSVVNVDATVVAEEPKMAPHIDKMRTRIAEDLGIDKNRVSVKATTSEGMGFEGYKEGISARAVAMIEEG